MIMIVHALYIILGMGFVFLCFALAVGAGTTFSEAQQHSFAGQLLGWIIGISVFYGFAFLFNELLHIRPIWLFFARYGIVN